MSANHSSQPSTIITSSSSFVTPSKEKHGENENSELESRWSPDKANFLELEEECPSRIRKKSLRRGSPSSPSSFTNTNNNQKLNGGINNRISFQAFQESFGSSARLFQSVLCGSNNNQISLRKKKSGRKRHRTKAMILFVVIAISVFLNLNDRDPPTILATMISLNDLTGGGGGVMSSLGLPQTSLKVRKNPFAQGCSLTAATKCPNATWLEDYYLEKYRRRREPLQAHQEQQVVPSSSSFFLGISIGCNKGFDAINTLRMGIYDSEIDKVKWKQAMTDNGTIALGQSVCNQDSAADMFPISTTNTLEDNHQPQHRPAPQGEMHCVEPMPQTYRKLQHSAETLGYTSKGLVVTHAAVSKTSGEMPFRTGGKAVGIENVGLSACQRPGPEQQNYCEMVKVYSLLEFVETKVKAPEQQNINVLSIDVEGFDGDVLLGATSKVLERVEYLEFEYNWMGSWKNQHLYDIVELLDQQADMVCYWAGRDRLWRITECWMSYYDVHSWSNVACANRRLVPELAAKMEETFLRTLTDETQWVKNRWMAYQLERLRRKYAKHKLLSLEEDKLRQKYI